MRVLSTVAEYNPFHNGHRLHLERGRSESGCDFVMVVLSGNFVQRGEPAIFDKFTRTRAALYNGADLVIELPLFYACASAEYFARGAVSLIQKTGISDCFCFGAETDSLDKLSAIAGILARPDPEFYLSVKSRLKTGVSYPVARSGAIEAAMDEGIPAGIIDRPNNILGIEYLKAINALGFDTRIVTVKRENDYHSQDIEGDIASATAIRQAIISRQLDKARRAIPESAFRLFEGQMESGGGPFTIDGLSHILHYILKTREASYFSQIFEITEGLENRILKVSAKSFLISDMISGIKTKRYAYTRIQRALMHIILDILKSELHLYDRAGGPQYIRVLGFRKDAEALVRRLSQNACLPLVMNAKEDAKKLCALAKAMLEREIASSGVYYLANTRPAGSFMEKDVEYRLPVVIV